MHVVEQKHTNCLLSRHQMLWQNSGFIWANTWDV